ncbi:MULTISPECIES: serine/threonine-protein kinase [Streptomyces]|uniref:non-specific serine/threonine protein kinase n=2 Tax=Streptomyces californicus TaxID=67351 RepID=A0ABD7D2E1_9ACTN|nr:MULTISPECIES: serine/threonine-protein kinase [Streptomyces]MYW82805.1 protein kinase [Streptomyces sp. SID8369]MCC0578843.1 serine/threonine-protein kinase [Streptomyces californicus]MDP9948152.1 serine/threonine protein kinase [Streptomyces sp. DSM 41269]QRV26663.1 serine/threonine protein kinase [Streptomyces californicus]QRV37674.1 serine/threonine protein kinase [Streptomyces californicus]
MTDPGLIDGRYRLVRPLGRGAMGVVYEAEDENLQRRVALKKLSAVGGMSADDEALARFKREAVALARIDHPGVVSLYDSGLHGDVPYFVMQLVDGVDLATLVEAGALTPGVACAVGLGVARALAAAHEAGVLHRDVKPTNVGITRQGSVVLHDFGLARLAGESAITRTGVTMGTPQFMAPEVIMGAAPGPTADLYGLGVCLHFMLTGNLPFGPAAEVGAVVDSALGAGIRPLSTGLFPFTPVNLALLVDRLCAREASARPRTAAEAVRLLEPFGGDDGQAALAELVAASVRNTAILQACETPAGTRETPPESGPEYEWDEHALPGPRVPRRDVFRPLTLSTTTRRLVLSSMTPQNAVSRQREAVNLVLRGELQEAAEMLSSITQVCLSSLGPDHPTTLAAQFWQAVCLARLGAGPKALELFSSVNRHTDQRGNDSDE